MVSSVDYTYNTYIYDVNFHNILVCKKVTLAVKRHLHDLEASKKDFPYYFDDEKAQNAISFLCVLVHTKGKWAGTPFKPEPWQQFIIAMLYGWRRKDTHKRRFTRAYIQVARKNGKTFFASGVALYDLLAEPGAEVYTAATKKDQAKACFNDARKTVTKAKSLTKLITVYKHSLSFADGIMTALSSDYDTMDGFNPSCAIIDEYHAHKTDSLLKVLESGMGAREQPMLFIITTAGHNKAGPCHEEYKRISKILERKRGFENENYFCIVYELDKKDDWKNEKNWIKANPNLFVSVSIEQMRIWAKNALQKSSDEMEFKTKNLNEWMNTVTAWITSAKWDKCKKQFSEKNLEGLDCYGGIDLSKRLDFTVLTWYFLIKEGRYAGKRYAKHLFFIPEEQIDIKMKTDTFLIRQWIKEGFIFATPGSTVDYDFMFNKIREDSKLYTIQEIAYDRNLADHLVSKLEDDFTLIEFSQGIRGMSEPSKDWEKQVTEGNVIDNNPVMEWMVSCTTVKPDANGNIKPLKPDANKSSKRIDGVITSIMANNRLQTALQEESEQNNINVDDLVF